MLDMASTQVQQRSVSERLLFHAELKRSVFLSPQTKHLEFSAADVDEFRFTPGQFISIKQPRPEGKIHTRAYSIASPPRNDATFDLCLNRVDDGFLSNWLCDLQPGATVQFHGPHGRFVLREPPVDSIFIATGTGIAPIRSMVEWLFAEPDRHRGFEYWLVFGTRYEHSIYYRSEFEAIATQHPNFHYVPTLSRCEDSWQGCRGYVQDYVRPIVADRPHMRAYICGLHQMVNMTRELLKQELGWDASQIVYERFD
jgi:ferredoxin-NADP reductase